MSENKCCDNGSRHGNNGFLIALVLYILLAIILGSSFIW